MCIHFDDEFFLSGHTGWCWHRLQLLHFHMTTMDEGEGGRRKMLNRSRESCAAYAVLWIVYPLRENRGRLVSTAKFGQEQLKKNS